MQLGDSFEHSGRDDVKLSFVGPSGVLVDLEIVDRRRFHVRRISSHFDPARELGMSSSKPSKTPVTKRT